MTREEMIALAQEVLETMEYIHSVVAQHQDHTHFEAAMKKVRKIAES